MAAELAAILSQNGAAGSVRRPLADEARVVVVGDEADLLAVRLVGDGQLPSPRVLADRILGTIAHREHRVRELLLRQREQEIRLILGRIDGAPEQESSGRFVALDPGVVAGGHPVRAEPAAPIGERGELQVAVAVRAGQRRPPRRILPHEVRDDHLFELPLEVDDVVGNLQRGGHAPRVVEIVDRTAAAKRPLVAGAPCVVELHGQTDDVMPLLGQQRGRH